jgi:CBS domain containing-hemolysin-like protein
MPFLDLGRISIIYREIFMGNLFHRRNWYLHPWGWCSVGVNIVLLILAHFFPMLFGGPVPRELENSRFQQFILYLMYPAFWLMERIYQFARVLGYKGMLSAMILSALAYVVLLLYWYMLGIILYLLRGRLIKSSECSRKSP